MTARSNSFACSSRDSRFDTLPMTFQPSAAAIMRESPVGVTSTACQCQAALPQAPYGTDTKPKYKIKQFQPSLVLLLLARIAASPVARVTGPLNDCSGRRHDRLAHGNRGSRPRSAVSHATFKSLSAASYWAGTRARDDGTAQLTPVRVPRILDKHWQ